MEKPKIVCICGSTKFIDEHAIYRWELEKQGIIGLGINLLPINHGYEKDHQAEKDGVKEILDNLHLRKIDLADEVHIINKNGYIGESTRREIEYAIKQNKLIKYIYKDI